MDHFNGFHLKFSFVLLIFLVASDVEAQTIYITPNGAGDQSGSSWTNAVPGTKLQDKINHAASGSQLWVAGGTYKPTTGTDRWASFYLPSSVKAYGGFAGTETCLAERLLNPASPSILSGDVGGKGVWEDCSEHVVVLNNVSDQTLLDGFEITHGHSLSPDGGGGIYIKGIHSNPIIANCIIKDNHATRGGGVCIENGVLNGTATNNPSFINCGFSQNKARAGGAVYIHGPDLLDEYGFNITDFVNCSFSQNTADQGGAFYSFDPIKAVHVYLDNCIVWNNTGGDLETKYDSPDGFNIHSSDISTQDPLFVDVAKGNLRLQACSPVINAGNNDFNFTDKDLDGNARVARSTIDMGAYEFQGQTGPATIINMPQPAIVCSGQKVKFRATAAGASLRFQWQKNEVDIDGATDSIYTIDAASAADTGNYKIIVSTPCGSPAVSDKAHLTVNAAPVPVVSVADNCGSSVLSTSAKGSLLWNTGEATPSITVNDARTYTVIQTLNGCTSNAGSGTAAPKTAPAKPVITASGGTSFYTGGSINLSAPAGFASYLWNTGSTNATITVTSGGSYSVTVTNSSGCSTTSDPTVITAQAPALTVSYMDGDKKQLTNNNISPYLQVNNEGNTSFDYKELTIRYWLTVEDFTSMINVFIDWAMMGNNKIKMKYVKLAQPRQGAYGYVEYSFDASAGTLAAKSNSGEIQSRIAKSDWTNFNEQDDYSYTSGTAYTKNSKITLYRNGSLVWGTEPAVTAIAQIIKAYSQDKSNAATTNAMSPLVKLSNEGNIPVNYKDITIRYWFTADGSQSLNWYLDYSKLGSSSIKAKFVRLSPAFDNADTYLEISFAVPDSLYPVSSTGDIQQRISNSNWSNFNQLNDYSYKAGSAMSENTKMTAYIKGTLVYGVEPSNVIAKSMAAGEVNVASKESDSRLKEAKRLSLTVLNNPVTGSEVEYIVKGAKGMRLQVMLTDVQGRIINVQKFEHAESEERHHLSIKNNAAGTLFLRAGTQNEVKVIQVMRAK